MPHSSGGGSHGGGSHGGHSHGHSGGGSGSRAVRRSNTYFPGSYRYVYYRNHRPVYYYREKQYTDKDLVSHRGSIIVMAIALCGFYGLFLVSILSIMFHFPRKLSLPYDSAIQIEDQLGLVQEEYDTIYHSFEVFRDKTGVVPALLVIPNSLWENHYLNLKTYAYDYYVNHFTDEKHWLIVYATDRGSEFEDWYWEGMQGDDTDPVITEQIADRFTALLQKKLTDRTHYTVGTAIASGFDELNQSVMKFSIQSGGAVVGLLFLLLHGGIFFYASVFRPLQDEKLAQNSMKLDAHKQYMEDKCEYCGGVYIHGMHLSCPHCGAPIRPADQPIDLQDFNEYYS